MKVYGSEYTDSRNLDINASCMRCLDKAPETVWTTWRKEKILSLLGLKHLTPFSSQARYTD
jgi:hypothetical protein